MKSRIVIMLSVTLAALLLVVGVVPKAMPTSPVLAQDFDYRYTVPFVCGYANDDLEGVKPANYATTVTIHNPQQFVLTYVKWKVVRVFPTSKVSSFTKAAVLGVNTGDCIRCKQIATKLCMAWPLSKYITGYVVIYSTDALDVNGVYTTEYDGGMGAGISIDVEQYGLNAWYG